MQPIHIENAWQENLAHLTLDLPKNRFTVVTGVSGSGKSTLLVNVLFQECQRKYLEALSMQGIAKPHVDRIRGASPAVLIPQTTANRNPRSTVGTSTDIYTDLRMLFEKLGRRNCPFCKASICAADCPEITERKGDDFLVWMDCPVCGHRMRKYTLTDFSFNTREGACPDCQGLGRITAIRKEIAVDESRSLEQGAVASAGSAYPTRLAFRSRRFPRSRNFCFTKGLRRSQTRQAARCRLLRHRGGLKGSSPCSCDDWLPMKERPETWSRI